MANYHGIQFETVNGFRVHPFKAKEHIYVLVLISPKMHHDFYIVNDRSGETVFMFGCAVADGWEAIELANANAIDYVPINWLMED